MYKCFILQGPRNDKAFSDLCFANDCCGGNMFDLRDNNPGRIEPSIKALALRIFYTYTDNGYNVAIHDDFKSNKEVAAFVRGADVRGYSVEFVRLPDATGEVLEWKECFI